MYVAIGLAHTDRKKGIKRGLARSREKSSSKRVLVYFNCTSDSQQKMPHCSDDEGSELDTNNDVDWSSEETMTTSVKSKKQHSSKHKKHHRDDDDVGDGEERRKKKHKHKHHHHGEGGDDKKHKKHSSESKEGGDGDKKHKKHSSESKDSEEGGDGDKKHKKHSSESKEGGDGDKKHKKSHSRETKPDKEIQPAVKPKKEVSEADKPKKDATPSAESMSDAKKGAQPPTQPKKPKSPPVPKPPADELCISDKSGTDCDENDDADRCVATPGPAGGAKPSAGSSQRPPKAVPKKQDGFLTREAASAILSSCQLTQSEFHDFVCARSFDVFSGGMYRKFLVQSRLAKEAWAFNVQSSICKVQKLSKMMVCVVNSVKMAEQAAGQQQNNLGVVLSACLNSSTPPVSRQVNAVRQVLARCGTASPCSVETGVVRCSITGSPLEDQCIEVRAASKAPASASAPIATKEPSANHLLPPVVVHQDFEHFFNMLWFCSKIEHVVRHTGKCWMEDFHQLGGTSEDGGGAEEEEEGSDDAGDGEGAGEDENGAKMQAMCEKYSKDNEETISDMHAAFIYAYEYVLESVYAHPSMVAHAAKQAQETNAPTAAQKPQTQKNEATVKKSSATEATVKKSSATEATVKKSGATEATVKKSGAETTTKKSSAETTTKKSSTETTTKKSSTDVAPKKVSTDAAPKKVSTDAAPKKASTDAAPKKVSTDAAPKKASSGKETDEGGEPAKKASTSSDKAGEKKRSKPSADDDAKPKKRAKKPQDDQEVEAEGAISAMVAEDDGDC